MFGLLQALGLRGKDEDPIAFIATALGTCLILGFWSALKMKRVPCKCGTEEFREETAPPRTICLKCGAVYPVSAKTSGSENATAPSTRGGRA